MSQAKVDRYKEEKRNREKLMKKQKRDWMFMKCGLGAVAAVVLVWAGFSVYSSLKPEAEVVREEYHVDISDLEDYLSGMTADVQ